MKNYINELDKLIKSSEDIALGKNLLSELSLDRAALISLVGEYFELMSKNTYHSSKGLSGNTLLLKGVSGRESNNIYLPLISYHQDEPLNSIVTQSIFSILTPINVPFVVESYLLPENWNSEIFDPTVKLQLDSTRILNPGEVLEIGPGRTAFHFRFHAPTIILKLQDQTVTQPYEWSFDVQTRIAWQSISSHPKDSYAQHLCLAAKKLRDERLVDPLVALLNHQRHFIRWSAAQALGAYGHKHGINALSCLVNDHHPHIAKAATMALKRLHDR